MTNTQRKAQAKQEKKERKNQRVREKIKEVRHFPVNIFDFQRKKAKNLLLFRVLCQTWGRLPFKCILL